MEKKGSNVGNKLRRKRRLFQKARDRLELQGLFLENRATELMLKEMKQNIRMDKEARKLNRRRGKPSYVV